MVIAQPLAKGGTINMKRFIILCTMTLSFLFLNTVSVSAYGEPLMLNTLAHLIEQQDISMQAAHQMAEAARQLDYHENHHIIKTAKAEWQEANNLKIGYQMAYDNLMKYQKPSEYPVATHIWNYLKELGYNDYVCAGILGNIMAEAGGQTLNIRPDACNGNYYGICQWGKAYSEVWGTSLEEQCAFLKDTIKYELDTFGYAYKDNFDYNSFLNLENCEQAAKAFAKCYERCGSGSYSVRQKNALTAYNYFTN